jgi:hypothetical protein
MQAFAMPSLVPPPLSASDYEAIEAALLQTSRGRWFLAEYARRNRHADTGMLLGALERLENVVRDNLAERNTPAASVGDLPAPERLAIQRAQAPPTKADPLAPLAAMSYEEKIALFT